MPTGDGSSVLDYMPITGPFRAFSGDGGDDSGGGSCLGGGGEEGVFIDCDPETGTGEEISGAYWKCAGCNGILRHNDNPCPSCGDSVEWDPSNPDHNPA